MYIDYQTYCLVKYCYLNHKPVDSLNPVKTCQNPGWGTGWLGKPQGYPRQSLYGLCSFAAYYTVIIDLIANIMSFGFHLLQLRVQEATIYANKRQEIN